MDLIKNAASEFLQKNSSSSSLPFSSTPPHPLRSVFSMDSLEEEEIKAIEMLLSVPHNFSHQKIEEDLKQLKNITAEVKNIRKQSIFLLGERIYQAREILNNYGSGKGAFKRWLEMTFSTSRRTAYNALAYFDFHQSIPDDHCRSLLKKMPQKVIYILASRKGSAAIKLEFIQNFKEKKSEEIISAIQEKFPLENWKKKKEASSAKIEKIAALLKSIDKDSLSERNKDQLQQVAVQLHNLLH